MDSLPPFPKGQQPPAPLAKFQNQVNKIEKTLYNNVGVNNQKLFPKIKEAKKPIQKNEEDKMSV